MKKWIHVTAAIIEKNGFILIARREKGEPFSGKWELPGGKVEEGESIRECLKRELKEELDIEARIGQLLAVSEYDYSGFRVRLYAFRVIHYAGVPKTVVHEQIKWIDPSEWEQYDLLEADIPLFPHLLKEMRRLYGEK